MKESILHNKIIKIFLAIFAVLVVGTVGYMSISDYSFINALYMTAITITTVGYGETQPLDESGRIFTMFLLSISMGTVAYSATTVGSLLLDGQLLTSYRERKNQKKIKALENHTIICGYGRNGRQAAVKLHSTQNPFVVIDRDIHKAETKLQNLFTPVAVEGDATQDEVLVRAGISRAKALIACLPDDADNLFIVLTARQLNPNLKIVSRASNNHTVRKLKIAGADHVIMPDKIGGEHMASLIAMPSVLEFLDTLSVEGSYRNNIIEVAVDQFRQEFIGKTLAELDIRNKAGVLVIGYKNPEHQYIINPNGEVSILPQSAYIILGNPDQIDSFKKVYLG